MEGNLIEQASRTQQIKTILEEHGICAIGFASISQLGLEITDKYQFAICFGIRYDDNIVNQLPNDEAWITMAESFTDKARRIYQAVQELLGLWGYHYSRVPSTTQIDELPDPGEQLPQKTLATLSSLGWIGKSSLLVNPTYGPRVRLGALLTDMPLKTDTPIVQSNCGQCRACVDVCPVGAIKGNQWSVGMPRSSLLDVRRCYEYCWRDKSILGRRHECGLCLKVCPIGQR